MNLPAGTITFLFTDIEGSTRLWEEQPEKMSVALAEHDALLRHTIEGNGGYVFKTVGDAFCAAFETAPPAVAAALQTQSALQQAAQDPERLPLKVRMVLHTGAAELRDRDYFGQTLNRTARLLAVGHGGQVLLSFSTQELVRDVLPEGASLKELGEHHLRDLSRPERIFQLEHPELLKEFAPLSSLENPSFPNNLPRQVTSFVGREKELVEVTQRMKTAPLLTLMGSGGCGKTRLSLQVAADVLEHFSEGVWLVELAPLTDPAGVVPTVAGVLGVREVAGEPLLTTLCTALKTRTLLLVLDNCEHVLETCRKLVTVLLQTCPSVRILAGSREALGVSGESLYRIPSLSRPRPGKTYTPESLVSFEAVRLFVERAMAVRDDFKVTKESAPALASICYRLDGIPLAIELAAARVRVLTVEQIEARLDNRFRLLTGGSRTVLPRQQTLRALIDWSYDLLNESEKDLLQRLSVFAGGWTLEAAEAICSGEGIEEWDVFDLLSSLNDKSLVSYEEKAGQARYYLLETVREYASEHLAERGGDELARVRRRHGEWYLALALEGEHRLSGSEQVVWLQRLTDEYENLRGGLEWSLGSASSVQEALRLCGALPQFWWTRGRLSEGRAWCQRALEQPWTDEASGERAKVLNGVGALAWMQGELTIAQGHFEESLAIRRARNNRSGVAACLNNLGLIACDLGDYTAAQVSYEESLAIQRELKETAGIAACLNNLGNIALYQGEDAKALHYYEESLALRRELGDRSGIGHSLNNLGLVACNLGDYTAARAFYEESLALQRDLEDQGGIATALGNLGFTVFFQGDLATARTFQEESLAIRRELGNKAGIAASLTNLSCVVCEQGEYALARTLAEEGLFLYQELGDRRGLAEAQEGLALLALRQGHPLRAAWLWGASEALREELGSPLPLAERLRQESLVAEARALLPESAFATAWAEGRALPREQVLARILGEWSNPTS